MFPGRQALPRWAAYVIRFGGCACPKRLYVRKVDEAERLLRSLALNDEESIERVLAVGASRGQSAALVPKVDLLVRLGALLAVGGATTSVRAAVERASEAGATEAELVAVLVAIAPAVGLARVVSAAPKLALAIGYDLEPDG